MATVRAKDSAQIICGSTMVLGLEAHCFKGSMYAPCLPRPRLPFRRRKIMKRDELIQISGLGSGPDYSEPHPAGCLHP